LRHAGNNRLNLDAYKSLGYANNPCFATSYGNVLCVGATDASGKTASFSNYGATAVHLSGPGSNIKSTYLGKHVLGVAVISVCRQACRIEQ
jgi:hypothetical protein